MSKKQNLSLFENSWRTFIRKKKRRDKKRRKRFGQHRHNKNIKEKALSEGREIIGRKKVKHFYNKKTPHGSKPKHSIYVNYLSSISTFYNKKHSLDENNGHLSIPEIFSLIDNETKSLLF
jgi:hypothetical protein